MNVLKDLAKIANQIRGKENMFGYKSTSVNQFYLTHCIMGEIYHSTKFHLHTKLCWFTMQISGILLGIFQLLSYLIFGDKEDVVALLYSIYVMIIFIFMYILIPYMAVVHYRGNLHEALRIADHLIMKRKTSTHETSEKLHLGKLFWYLCVFNVSTLSMYCFVCYPSIIFFYEEEKVKNYRYYLSFIPKLDQYGSLNMFLICNGIIGFLGCGLFLCCPLIPFMFVFWAVVFHNEVQQIIADLNMLSSNSDLSIETYENDVAPKFKNVITKCVRDYQYAGRMIECFRGFYEAVAAIILPTLLYIEITHAFLFVSPDISMTVRIREISVFLTTIQFVFALCWTGEVLEESVQSLSFAVYSTPWYWSTLFRKDIYILLCQTQRSISAKTLGAYALSLATFLRFMNITQSSVNVLRTITSE